MATVKECGRCNFLLELKYFHKNKNTSDGLQKYCKTCVKIYVKNNKDTISFYQKQYRLSTKEKAAKYNKNYRIENAAALILQKSDYRRRNKSKIAAAKKVYEKNKLNNDPSFKLRKRLSLFVRLALNGNKQGFSILEFLPYSIEKLKLYLESLFEPWMSWDNWGVYNSETWNDNDKTTWTWQLDHVIPQCQLPYQNMDEENFKKCWTLENLRPLSAKINILNGSKTRSKNE